MTPADRSMPTGLANSHVASKPVVPNPCAFCAILAGEAPATIVRSWPTAIAIKPLNPVTEGHTLVIPATHVRDATEDPEVSALAMAAAAEYAAGVGPCNVITSVGREATQTVFHLHIHVVPRRGGDGLALPWTPHAAERRAANAEERLSLARDALLRDDYFTPDQIGPDIAPRITERLSALSHEMSELRHELEQWHAAYGETALPGMLARLSRAETANARTRERLDALIAAGFGAVGDTLRELRSTLDGPDDDRG